ncbi:MAG: hypothetical protein IMW93_05805 [Thermoanaerobacteraceae bacterium]|nr:hypothetical protein [Thermoanaerobacteraceae bacterium]
MRQEIKNIDNGLRQENKATESNLRQEIKAVDSGLRQEINTLRQEIRTIEKNVYDKLDNNRTWTIRLLMAVAIGFIGMIVTLIVRT